MTVLLLAEALSQTEALHWIAMSAGGLGVPLQLLLGLAAVVPVVPAAPEARVPEAEVGQNWRHCFEPQRLW